MRTKTIKEVIPRQSNLFSHLNYDFPDISSRTLSLRFLSLYGERPISPVVALLQDTPDSVLDNDQLDILGETIVSTYRTKWDKYFSLLDSENEYNPLSDYKLNHEGESALKSDIDRTGTDTSTLTRNMTDKQTLANTDKLTLDTEMTNGGTQGITRTDNLTQTNNLSNQTQNGIAGFNSTAYSNSTNSNASDTGTVTNTGSQKTDTTNNLTEERTGTETTEHSGSITNQATGTDTNALERSAKDSREDSGTNKFTEFGYRNRTPQSLITEELRLWRTNFINIVLDDVKELLCLPIYEYSRLDR